MISSTVPGVVARILPSGVTTTAPLTASQVAMPIPVEVAAVFAGALSGAVVGVRRGFDVVGVMTLAIASGLGGGIIRDVLLQKYGIVAFQNPRLLITAFVAAAIGFFFTSAAERSKPAIFLIDTVSLSLFALIGADKALRADLLFLPAVMLGTITCVGGAMLRDVLCGEVPESLRPGTFYATAALAGSTVFVMLASWLNVVKFVAAVVSFAVIAGLRLLSVHRGWQTPRARDLTPAVTTMPRRVLPSRWLRRKRESDEREEPIRDDESTEDDGPPRS